MIINNAPANEAVLSNVGEIGEFRIRNSAKAFNILSSGLYANKIRAIIRELSCNAVDSHTAAGKADTPFDVHLPNQLEAHFSIRDYGTGLSHDQVTNIYTTYFESTKTNSNDFIGALGLGSKSPFSYTDNFTVTAIKDGRKGIYTAFINEAGVPSIALMMEEQTDEPSGVEVKFAVTDHYDTNKFRQEAREVYKYFSLKPVISGNADFTFELVDYESKDIIPGVHSYKNSNSTKAIMGNIAYPIDLPRGSDIGGMEHLLKCGLELHFDIGELDFQASREGLSYIPQTIEAIKRKLEALNAVLATKIADEADVIENLWERAAFLSKKKSSPLWHAAVDAYATTAQLPTFIEDRWGGWQTARLQFKVSDLSSLYNIQLRGIHRARYNKAISSLKTNLEYSDTKNATGNFDTWHAWNIAVNVETHFVLNNTKIGATERARYHYRETEITVQGRDIYIVEAVDKTKPMKTDEFFKALHNPPAKNIVDASTLLKRERNVVNKDVTILHLTERNHGGYYRSQEMVWRDAGDTSKYADKDMNGKPITYYYVPLNGYTMQSAKGYTSGRELYDDVKSVPNLFKGEIYGVRKKDLEEIKKRANWKNFEEHIVEELAKMNTDKVLRGLVRAQLRGTDILGFDASVVNYVADQDSPYTKLISGFKGVEKYEGSGTYKVERLFKRFAPKVSLSPDALLAKYQSELDEVNNRYPLLQQLNTYRTRAEHIAQYVNLIDKDSK